MNPEALERMRATLGLGSSQPLQNYDDFVKADLDIVFLGTPMPFHAEQATKAPRHGKHVLSEVTMATAIRDCERIVRTAKKTRKKYMMAKNYYYLHYIQEWKKMIREGRFGESCIDRSIRPRIQRQASGKTIQALKMDFSSQLVS
jgi:predicted dehydrogenase